MPIDTKAERMSMLNHAMPLNWGHLFERDGAVNEDDRLTLLHLYGGITANVIPFVEPLPHRIVRHTGRYV